MKTQVASVYVYGEIESYNPQGATSVSVAILVVSLAVLVLLERLTRPPGERWPDWPAGLRRSRSQVFLRRPIETSIVGMRLFMISSVWAYFLVLLIGPLSIL